MKTITLDKRYNGFEFFKYAVNFHRSEKNQFIAIRNWCWQTWGPSCEIENFSLAKDPVWAWESSQWNTRLYFQSEKELNWYNLKWK